MKGAADCEEVGMGNSANPSESSDAGKDCHLVPDTDPLRAKDCSLGV